MRRGRRAFVVLPRDTRRRDPRVPRDCAAAGHVGGGPRKASTRAVSAGVGRVRRARRTMMHPGRSGTKDSSFSWTVSHERRIVRSPPRRGRTMMHRGRPRPEDSAFGTVFGRQRRIVRPPPSRTQSLAATPSRRRILRPGGSAELGAPAPVEALSKTDPMRPQSTQPHPRREPRGTLDPPLRCCGSRRGRSPKVLERSGGAGLARGRRARRTMMDPDAGSRKILPSRGPFLTKGEAFDLSGQQVPKDSSLTRTVSLRWRTLRSFRRDGESCSPGGSAESGAAAPVEALSEATSGATSGSAAPTAR